MLTKMSRNLARSLMLVIAFFLTFLILYSQTASANDYQYQVEMLKDINTSTTDSDPSFLFNWGSYVYFKANDGHIGVELWRTDGTAEGTELVKDINPGEGHGNPELFVHFKGEIYFSADDGTNGSELWKTDGTEEGTVMVKDIYPDVGGSGIKYLTPSDDLLFFTANDGPNGTELWKTDGTEVGTAMVKDIHDTGSSIPKHLAAFDSMVIFQANDGNNGTELWKSDGTSNGTKMIKDIRPGAGHSHPVDFTPLGSEIIFTAEESTHGKELWRTDGTKQGTLLVKDIYNGSDSSGPNYLTKIGSEILFEARDEGNGSEIWKSDGTEEGTLLVKDIRPGASHSNINSMVAHDGKAFFLAQNESGRELWKSDGTPEGTGMVKDIRTGSGSSEPTYLTSTDSYLFFRANNDTMRYRLWRTDGTESGTVMVNDTFGELENYDYKLCKFGEYLAFSLDTSYYGVELWKTNGTDAGTDIIRDINLKSNGGLQDIFGILNSELIFVADDWHHGKELWKTDGTEEGTQMIKDILPGLYGGVSSSFSFGKLDNEFYFSGSDGEHGRELWKTDGTAEGTVLVKDIYQGSDGADPGYFVTVGSQLFFTAETNYGRELWKTDGTADGTELVKDIWPGSTHSRLGRLINFDSELYFYANDGANGSELWKSDGTTEGTKMVKDICEGSCDGVVRYGMDWQILGSKLCFFANDDSTGWELWSTDGTTADTKMVKDIRPGSASSKAELVSYVFDSKVYFTAEDNPHGRELWMSDGTSEGTELVKDIRPGSSDSNVYEFIDLDDKLYFSATNGSDWELWRTDGTEEGTHLFKDLRSEGSSSPEYFFKHGSTFLFAAYGDGGTAHLWVCNGTTEGTKPVVGSDLRYSQQHIVFKNKVFFKAYTSNHSFEMWVLESYESDPPISVPGGPYDIQEGVGLELDGSGSYSVNSTVSKWEWDLDGDGEFDDASGRDPFMEWEDMVDLGVDDDGNYTIGLRVIDELGIKAVNYTILTIFNVPPQAILNDVGPTDEGSKVWVNFTEIIEPSVSDILLFSFDWDNDGTFEVLDSTTSAAWNIWADEGPYRMKARIADDDGGFNDYTINVTITNVAPKIINLTIPMATQNALYLEELWADDPGYSDTLIWSLEGDISWLGLDNETGTLSGTPSNANVGTHWFNITVTDGDGGSDRRMFTLRVDNINDAPTIITTPPHMVVKEQRYSTTFQAVDIDGDVALTWNLSVGPDWLSINATTGELSGTPSGGEVGTHSLNVSVTDTHGSSDWLAFTLTVISANSRPTIVTVPITEARVGTRYTVEIEATDADGVDTLTWSLMGSADWLTIDPDTGVLSGTPVSIGSFEVKVMVQDSLGANDSINFTLVVKAPEGQADDDDDDGLPIFLIIGVVVVLVVAVGGFLAFRQKQAGAPKAPAGKAQAPAPMAPIPSPPSAMPASSAYRPPEKAPAPSSEHPQPPTPEMVTIQCPGCQGRMKIPKLGKLQQIKCASCGLQGELEV